MSPTSCLHYHTLFISYLLAKAESSRIQCLQGVTTGGVCLLRVPKSEDVLVWAGLWLPQQGVPGVRAPPPGPASHPLSSDQSSRPEPQPGSLANAHEQTRQLCWSSPVARNHTCSPRTQDFDLALNLVSKGEMSTSKFSRQRLDL